LDEECLSKVDTMVHGERSLKIAQTLEDLMSLGYPDEYRSGIAKDRSSPGNHGEWSGIHPDEDR
jgi:hypothetical protein